MGLQMALAVLLVGDVIVPVKKETSLDVIHNIVPSFFIEVALQTPIVPLSSFISNQMVLLVAL